MAYFASPHLATYDGWFRRGRQSAPRRKPDGDNPSLHPSIWITLAEDALMAGRIGQAEEFVERAYLGYDEAMTSAAISVLGYDEEEVESDLQ
jgi:hypothetical protein